MKRIILAGLVLALIVPLAACTKWEKTTYQTLAATSATIAQAQKDYAAGTIPNTKAAYDALNKAVAANNAADTAMITYESAKANGGTTASLSALQVDVNTALLALPAIITDVKALYATTGGK